MHDEVHKARPQLQLPITTGLDFDRRLAISVIFRSGVTYRGFFDQSRVYATTVLHFKVAEKWEGRLHGEASQGHF
jgi:hypothetical protein